MFLIQNIYSVWKLNKGLICFYCLNSICFSLYFYYLNGFQSTLYPLIISIFFLIVFFIIAGLQYSKLAVKVENAKDHIYMEYDHTALIEKMVFETTNSIHKNYQRELYERKMAHHDQNTLFTQWIHNMKVSISVIELASNKGLSHLKEGEIFRDINDENQKLKENLEQCLHILRLDDFSRDYIPEKVSLPKLVSNAVNAKRKDFIYRGVFPKVDIHNEVEVYTDAKWCSYMIEQIVSNSIKYSQPKQNKKVQLTLKENEANVELIITDEGIGIPLEDLPRVFHPFYTGRNGRMNEGASGIGLYMVKSIAEKLGHTVRIDSEPGKGTTVVIGFSRHKTF